jgi:hypothetical protein
MLSILECERPLILLVVESRSDLVKAGFGTKPTDELLESRRQYQPHSALHLTVASKQQIVIRKLHDCCEPPNLFVGIVAWTLGQVDGRSPTR